MEVIRNPAWYIAVLLFVAHQFVERVVEYPLPFIDSFLDTLLAVPVLLGLLCIERGYLFNAPRLSAFTVVVAVLAFAFVFEYLFPRWQPAFTADWVDVGLYALGGVYFWRLINPEGKVLA